MSPRHCSAYGQCEAQPKSILGFTSRWPHFLHRRVVSSLKNSTWFPHLGHLTSKIAPGFQQRLSCPGHFMVCYPALAHNSTIMGYAFSDFFQRLSHTFHHPFFIWAPFSVSASLLIL
jgi:hypothetical protein